MLFGRRISNVLFLPILFSSVALSRGDQLLLKDGFEISGNVSSTEFQVLVTEGLRGYTFSSKQVLKIDPNPPDQEPDETYSLNVSLPKVGRRIDFIQGNGKAEPFDSFGRRTVNLIYKDKKEIAVHQAITSITPRYLIVDGLNYTWKSMLLLEEMPTDQLLAILKRITKSDSLPDRLKLAHFLIQAKLFSPARTELSSIKKEFPDSTDRVSKLEKQLSETLSKQALAVVKQAISTGQFRTARRITDELLRSGPPELDVPLWQSTKESMDKIEGDIARAQEMISQSLATTSTAGVSPAARKVAEEIIDLVSPANVDRLEPLLALSNQPDSTPVRQLSLAVTGWVAGPKLAQQETEQAKQFAQWRSLLQACVHATSEENFEIALDKAGASELTPELAAAMIPLLPAPAVESKEGETITVDLKTDALSVTYLVVLPPDYDRTRYHPAIVTLRGVSSTAEGQLKFWQNAAARLGAVLVAPTNVIEEKKGYEYSLEEHARYLAVLADMRRRFSIDSNRIFLTGHEIGAFAAFDLGISHPDEIAGLISICGVPQFYSQYYWRNLSHLPIYAVDGRLNGDNPATMSDYLDRVFRNGDPTLSVLYLGRGRGWFESELPHIVEWIKRQKRDPFPVKIEGASARHSDKRFYWLEVDSFLPNATIAPKLFDKKKGIKPAKLMGELTRGNTLSIETAGLETLRIHLSPQLIQFYDPKLTIKVNRKIVHEGPIKPELATLLSEVRRTGDRARLVMRIIPAKN